MDILDLPDFEELAGIGKNIGSIAEAGAAAGRSVEHLAKGIESAAEMAIELDRTLPFGRDCGISPGDKETGAGAAASSTAPDRQADECVRPSAAYGRPGQHMSSKRCPGRDQSNGGSCHSLGR